MMTNKNYSQTTGEGVRQDPNSVEIVPWASGAPKGCNMPKVLCGVETQLYEKVRAIHCDRKKSSHDCHGRVTLDRNGMTLQCPLCGDTRSIYRHTDALTEAGVEFQDVGAGCGE